MKKIFLLFKILPLHKIREMHVDVKNILKKKNLSQVVNHKSKLPKSINLISQNNLLVSKETKNCYNSKKREKSSRYDLSHFGLYEDYKCHGFFFICIIAIDCSFAYQKCKSTNMCINDLISTISRGENDGRKLAMLSLGTTKSCGYVDLNKSGKMVIEFEIPTHLKFWNLNFLSFRILVMGSNTDDIHGGLLKISCLSPVLFNLYANCSTSG